MTKSLLCIAPTDWAGLRSKRAITYYTSSLPERYQGAGHLYRWGYRYGNKRIEEVIS